MAKSDNRAWVPLLKSYPDSEKVNNVSFEAETLFTRLLSKCDDSGNFFGSKKQILGKLFTKRWDLGQVSERKVGKWLAELVEQKLVVLYEVNGEQYLHIVNCKKVLRKDRPRQNHFPLPKSGMPDDIPTDGQATTTGYVLEQELEQEQYPPTPQGGGQDSTTERAQEHVGHLVRVSDYASHFNVNKAITKARASCEKYSDEVITAAIEAKGREAKSWGLIEHYLDEQQRRDDAVAKEKAVVDAQIEADQQKYDGLRERAKQEAQT